jgi:hypothetical protein
MSSIWAFPDPGERRQQRGRQCWPGWSLSTSEGWPLDTLDPKLLMRLGPVLADELARLSDSSAVAAGTRVYVTG